MQPEKKIDPLVARHEDFWNRKLKQPIINIDLSVANRILYTPALPTQWEEKDALIIEPDMCSPEQLQPPPIVLDGEAVICDEAAFNSLFPYNRIPYLAGIMGCDLRVSTFSRTLWPLSYLQDDWYKQKNQGFKPRLQWLDKLLEFTSYCIDQYYPDRCVPTLDGTCRSPGDLIVQLLGPERTYFSLYDHPDEIKALLDQMTEIYIHWVQSQLDILPRVEGGYCNQYGIWSHGTTIRTQEDYAVNLSQNLFMEFILPCTKKVVQAFDYQICHTHSGFTPLAEWLLEIDELKAIEIVLDPYGPALEELIPLCNRILDKKSLIIVGPVTDAQIELLISSLSPYGLWLDVEPVTEEELAEAWSFEKER